ncbi:MAG: hypothetical protein MRERV_18c022 [Mycoplasmataceae bacterium RV_VA103A]|nr:MAG: hypothetical protein MRERV_18c022 [Mycoplasmataceae bacterium RV_VA103A]
MIINYYNCYIVIFWSHREWQNGNIGYVN